MMANFVRGRGDMMGVAGALNDNADICAPVLSYWPNDFGLYCMAGNVNEWVQDVYRSTSFDDVDEFRPFRGNTFQTLERDEEGNVAEKDSLGRLRYRDVTEAEAFGRRNYRRADNINYMDGDKSSSLQYRNEDATDEPGSNRMYQQGATIDKGQWYSLVNDHARVYKGGGWKDRAYWLAPGSRRYLDESHGYGSKSREWRSYYLERYIEALIKIKLNHKFRLGEELSFDIVEQRWREVASEIQAKVVEELDVFIDEGQLPAVGRHNVGRQWCKNHWAKAISGHGNASGQAHFLFKPHGNIFG